MLLALTIPRSTLSAQASTRTEVDAAQKAALVKLEHEWADAISRRDTSFLNHLLDDDVIDTSYRGRIRGKADALTGSAAPGAVTQTLRDLHVRLFGDTALVTGLNIVRAKNHSYTARVRFTDIFRRSHSKWKAIGAQETLERAVQSTPPSK